MGKGKRDRQDSKRKELPTLGIRREDVRLNNGRNRPAEE